MSKESEYEVPPAWIELPQEAEVRRLIPAGSPYDFGFVAPMQALVTAHPRLAASFAGLYAQIMFAPGALTRREREMIAAVSASAQDCFY